MLERLELTQRDGEQVVQALTILVHVPEFFIAVEKLVKEEAWNQFTSDDESNARVIAGVQAVVQFLTQLKTDIVPHQPTIME